MINQKQHLGWREWVALPDLGIPAIRAKLDTGARTSALHTFALGTFTANQQLKVRFGVHPLSNRIDIECFCVADVIDQRVVKNQTIGVITDPFGENEASVLSSTAGVVIGRLDRPLVNEGEALFHIARFDDPISIDAALDTFTNEFDSY